MYMGCVCAGSPALSFSSLTNDLHPFHPPTMCPLPLTPGLTEENGGGTDQAQICGSSTSLSTHTKEGGALRSSRRLHVISQLEMYTAL